MTNIRYVHTSWIHAWCIYLRGSLGLSARRVQRTKSRWPKGHQLEVGSQRSPRLLVDIRLPVFIIPVDLRHDANNIEVLSSIFLRGNSQVFSFIHLIQIFRWNTWKCFSFSQIAFVAVPSVFLYLSVLLKISRLFQQSNYYSQFLLKGHEGSSQEARGASS